MQVEEKVTVCVCGRPTCAAMRWGRRCCTAGQSLRVHEGPRDSEPSGQGGEDKVALKSGSNASTLP